MAAPFTIELNEAMKETKPARSVNVLFINPPVPGFDKSYAKLLTFNTIPLALLYPATVLKEAGHVVAINDVKSGQTLRIPSNVEVVGITTDTVRYPEALAIAKYAKRLGKIVVMGGNHVTFDAENTLNSGYVDYIVRGEGEITMLNLINALSWGEGFNPAEVGGITWKNRDGEIVANPATRWIKDLDNLPIPDHNLLQLDLYRKASFNRFGKLGKPMFQIAGSRGCPYDCSFCIVTSVYGAKWRARSPENMLYEVQQALKLGFDNFFFVDDLFSTNYKRTIEFCELILQKGLKFTWSAQCSCNSIADHPEMVQLMAKAGCEAVLLGVENMDAETLKLYRKRATVDDNFQAVQTLKKYGIVSLASTIIGTPHETHESLNRNFQYLMELNPEMLWVNILTPYVGTDDWQTYQDRIFDRDWHHYDVYHSVMKLDYLSKNELEFAQKKMMTMYHTRPKYLFSNLPNLFGAKGWPFGGN
jgi:anaerobic magnesium-protoporphyrin IX monomethyl ester cyclase